MKNKIANFFYNKRTETDFVIYSFSPINYFVWLVLVGLVYFLGKMMLSETLSYAINILFLVFIFISLRPIFKDQSRATERRVIKKSLFGGEIWYKIPPENDSKK